MKHSLRFLEKLIAESIAKGGDMDRADAGHWIEYARRHHLRSIWAWWCWITGTLRLWPWTAWALIRRAKEVRAQVMNQREELVRFVNGLDPDQQRRFADHLESSLRKPE